MFVFSQKNMEKTKGKKFLSLSQGEILGFDEDELVNVNITKLKKYFYYLIGNNVVWKKKFWKIKTKWKRSDFFKNKVKQCFTMKMIQKFKLKQQSFDHTLIFSWTFKRCNFVENVCACTDNWKNKSYNLSSLSFFLSLFSLSLSAHLAQTTVSFGYILNGFYVGWSSKFFSFEEESMDSHYVSFVIQFKIKSFHDIDVWWQFDFSYHLSKTVSSISNIVDHFSVPSRSRDFIDFTFQILLFLWNKIAAFMCINFDFAVLGDDNSFQVNYNIFQPYRMYPISINVFELQQYIQNFDCCPCYGWIW